jgi:hypothetical protein
MIDTESIKLEQQNNIIYDAHTISWPLPQKTATQSKETPNKYQDDEYKTQLQNLVKLMKSGSTNNKHYRNNILHLYNLSDMLTYIHTRQEYLEQYA